MAAILYSPRKLLTNLSMALLLSLPVLACGDSETECDKLADTICDKCSADSKACTNARDTAEKDTCNEESAKSDRENIAGQQDAALETTCQTLSG